MEDFSTKSDTLSLHDSDDTDALLESGVQRNTKHSKVQRFLCFAGLGNGILLLLNFLLLVIVFTQTSAELRNEVKLASDGMLSL